MSQPILREISGNDTNYTIHEKLGQGAFGTVFKARRISDGQLYAKKVIPVSSRTSGSILSELRSIAQLRGCPKVVEWSRDVVQCRASHGYEVHLHMRYYQKGDLAKRIKFYRSANSEFLQIEVLDIFLDLTVALKSCHSNGIIHRDIKPANILLEDVVTSTPSRGSRVGAVLADFGVGKFMSSEIRQGTLQASRLGDSNYTAPEAESREIGPQSDVFSLGCVMFEMCELRPAFYRSEKRATPNMASLYSRSIKHLIMSCLALDKHKRPLVSSLENQLRDLKWQQLQVLGLV